VLRFRIWQVNYYTNTIDADIKLLVVVQFCCAISLHDYRTELPERSGKICVSDHALLGNTVAIKYSYPEQ
jgi:hypothetical protein